MAVVIRKLREELDLPGLQDGEMYYPAPEKTHMQNIFTQTFVWKSRLEAVSSQSRFFFFLSSNSGVSLQELVI